MIIKIHELRTPLNIILNTSKLLLDKCENHQCFPEYCCPRLAYIKNNSNRLLRSVNNSIDVAKLDSNVYDVNFSMINIVDYIVKKFIDILDGTISVESTLGVGTTFYIVLPKREVDKIDTDKAVNSLDRMKYLINLEFCFYMLFILSHCIFQNSNFSTITSL